jgi:hypothetical protein
VRRLLLAPMVAFAVTASAYSTVGEQIDRLQGGVDDLRGQATEIADRAQFCFAITRAVTSAEGGSSLDEASDAAEEVLTQAPDELRADAELVTTTLRDAADAGDPGALQDPEFQEAAQRLRDDTRELCDPTGDGD